MPQISVCFGAASARSEERQVPLFVLGDAFSLDADAAPKQTEICGTVCELLGVPHDKPVCRELLK